MRCLNTYCSLLFCVFFWPLLAQEQPVENLQLDKVRKSWTVSFFFENDLFVNTDENYTNGVKLSWLSPDVKDFAETHQLPAWTHQLIEWLPFIHQEGNLRNVAFSIGQNMYTPKDITQPNLIPTDRPYAGWLYGGLAFYSRSVEQMDVVEISVGFVGSWSLAYEAQDFVHSMRGIVRPEGWDNQLSNELALNLFWERRHRIRRYVSDGGWGLDVFFNYGAALGNVAVFGKVGTEARVGYNLPVDFGTGAIRFGGDTAAPVDAEDPSLAGRRSLGCWAFTGIEGHAIGHDIFLDGNTFANSHSVDKRYFVGSLYGGVGMVWNSWKLTLNQILRTRQFDRQERPHVFGSITASFTY